MRMPQHDVRNDGLGPYAVFYCEQCNAEYRSNPATVASVANDVTRGALGGLLRNIPLLGDSIADNVGRQDPRYIYALTPEQLDSAWEEVQTSFRECPTCSKVVCLRDWDEVAGTCKEDSPRGAEIEREQAERAAEAVKGFAGAFGLGSTLQNLTDTMRTASANLAVCSQCSRPAAPGTKFCPHCGGAMVQPNLRTCSNCHQPVPAGMQFCPNCGTKVEEAAAAAAPAPEPKRCPNCGAMTTTAFCGNCGTKVS